MSSLCCAGCEGGQCSEGRVQVRGRSPAGARAPLRGPGARDGGFFQRLRPPLGPRQHSMGLVGPASWPDGRLAGAVLVRPRVRQLAPSAPPRFPQRSFLTHEDTSVHARGKRPFSRGEAQPAYNSGGDEAPFTSGVCLITRRQTWLFYSAPPLSHTHSRREPGKGGD